MSDEAMALALLLSTLERIAVAVERMAKAAEEANNPPKNPKHYEVLG
jgi:hypothetical protein